ncbi:ABC transporter ATP-binding protein [Eubacterium aggregans]|uniref:ABC transporter ATP-binding protein n=1 Tax=Eubacterium aggregans TaxID=81409 RepID=UPI0023F32CC7|nr:ABC transporter ATP-binding protein [Eubacterium aggregans]MDD4692630.1 ABC transporter ATP-binding protein [Eubacterium aggregans]
MTKLKKYLKPFTGLLIMCVILLFIQAMSDLNLPNFMSDIINVGIQQGGIEHAAPEAISADGYDFITSFMTEDQQKTVSESYKSITPEDATESQKKNYPLLNDHPVYLLTNTSKDNWSTLDTIFGEADWTFINFIQDKNSQGQDTSKMDTMDSNAADMSGNLDEMDITQIYPLTPALKTLPQDAFDTARTKALNTPESTRNQTGAMLTKMFYSELGMDTGHIQTMYILRIGLYMLGLSLLGITAAIIVGLFSAKIAAGASQTLRRDIFKKVESFSNTEFNRFSTASLITRSTNDITQLQTMLIMGIRMICYAPIMGIGGIIMAIRQSPSMSWIIAVAVLVLVGMISIVFSLVMPRFKIIQKLVDRLNLVMRENLNGMSVIRAFGNQAFEKDRFKEENTRVTQNNLFVNRTMVFMMPAMMLIMNGITLVIVWVGAHQIAASTMQVGDMMAFMQYAMQIIMSFLMISMMFIMIPRASVSGDRIAEVLDVEPAIKDPATPVHFPGKTPGKMVFDDVSFRYEGADEDVLHAISFEAIPGQTTAFIGSTGSGKSTLINLIPRFYDVTGGRITLDGTDIRDVTLHELRDHIGYVPQKGVLFSGTIDSNLRYGRPDASDADIRVAADIAQAAGFIESEEEQYAREIAQGGANVSGGQKQRLSIARALTKKPDVYIFDDSFSALDFKTDVALRSALKDYTENATVLIVAQRINTIMNAEQIIVLDEGRMVGKGTHTQLLKTCETYREIAYSQLSEEELANA